MKKLSMVCVLILGLLVAPAFALEYVVDFGQNNTLDNAGTTAPGNSFVIDVYADNFGSTVPVTSGGVWVDFSGSVAKMSYVSATQAIPPWQVAGVVVDEPAGAGTIMMVNVQLAGITPNTGALADIKVGTFTFNCDGAGDASILFDVIPATGTWGPNPPYNDAAVVAKTLTVHQVCECTTDADCDDDLWCTGVETCVSCACIPGTAPCDDSNECTVDGCDDGLDECVEPKTCDESVLSGPTDPCCSAEPCKSGSDICGAEVTVIKNDGFYQPPVDERPVTIKNKICLDNPGVLVGGIQFDICDVPDCLICIDCELTERTVIFDCFVLELPNGCCRVILMSKNPGGAINPGLCDVVTIVMQTKPGAPAECGTECIEENIDNIVASDYLGYLLASAGIGGTLCPIVCGDVCPAGGGLDIGDCGDGVVDIYDIMCEVDFALTATIPNVCQAARADVPTGTPPDCIAPDGSINILDIMVLIDMALNRQDCCSFYYLGIMY